MNTAASIYTHRKKHTQLIRQTCYVNYKYPRGFDMNALLIASSLAFVRLCGCFINHARGGCRREGGGSKKKNKKQMCNVERSQAGI